MRNDRELLRAFLHGEVEARGFRHENHVRVGFELLCDHPFPEALTTYSAALKGMAARAGHPEAYHETITVAFLALIAERRAATEYTDFEAFAKDHPDLLDKSVLERWYTRARLFSDLARRTFVLPAAGCAERTPASTPVRG